MARAALAPETVIANDLRQLRCSPRNFCALAQFPYGTFSVVMTERIDFTPAQVERLREKLEQMKTLQDSVGVPINWAATDEIANALMTRLVAQVAAEVGDPDTKKFEQYAKNAEEFVK